jgi:hypothetical protein
VATQSSPSTHQPGQRLDVVMACIASFIGLGGADLMAPPAALRRSPARLRQGFAAGRRDGREST